MGILAILIVVYGLLEWYRWRQAVVELRGVFQSLETSHGWYGHRDLYRAFEHISQVLHDLAKGRPAARWVLDDLRPVVAQYHRRAVMASAGAWAEIRNAFLERKRHPVRVTRAAAGWVVLIGLSGTVLGFMEALPALRDVLAPQGDEIEAAPPPPSGVSAGTRPAPAVSDQTETVALTGQKLHRVLDSLQGVFLATFAGVICAFLLSMCNLLLLEPAFDRFADSVDAIGARWFEPLIQAPNTLIDDALRGELRSYFDEIGKRLEAELSPIVSQLRVSLEKMSGLASDFSSNIRIGASTLQTFREAVEKLGGSADGAVAQLGQIVKTSGDFVKEVESLQEKGLEKLAEALSGPTGILASSATAIDARVQALEGEILALGEASRMIATAIAEHSLGELALQKDLSSTGDVLRGQNEAISDLRASVDAIAKSLREELTPLFEALSQTLSRTQSQSARESRSSGERMADGIDSIHGMLTSLQALASPERIQEEGLALKELRRSVENLSHQLEHMPKRNDESRAASRPESEEQLQLFREIRDSIGRLVEGSARGIDARSAPREGHRVPHEHREIPTSERGVAKLLRWLGFVRTPGGRS